MKYAVAALLKLGTGMIVLAFASKSFGAFNVNLIGDASTYAILYEGSGGHNLQINSSAVQNQFGNYSIQGNIGLGTMNGGNPTLQLNNPAVVNGNVNFAATNNGHIYQNSGTLNGTVNYGVSQVNSDLTLLNNLSAQLGAEAGAALNINLSGTGGSQTINASSGTLDGSGNRVFNLMSMTFNNGNSLIINGDAAGDSVVINVNKANVNNPHFAGSILLTGGLTWDDVLINVTGGDNLMLSGGNTLQTSANNAYQYATYLDPNGTITLNSVNIIGHVFGGDSADMQIVSGATITIPEAAPGSITLGAFCLFCLATAFGKSRRNAKHLVS